MRFGRVYSRRRRLMSCSRRWMTREARNLLPLFNAPTIVCVTACPAGIAHTYMAAEYLEKAGRKLGVNVYVEKQGANGIEGRLTADQLNSATACILRLKSPSRRVSVLMAFPRFQCLLPSRFAMQKR